MKWFRRAEPPPSPRPPRPPRPRQLTPRPAERGPWDPDREIDQARFDLALAEAEVERISKALLDRLLQKDITNRHEHFDDPDLTPADRLLLRASVTEHAGHDRSVRNFPSRIMDQVLAAWWPDRRSIVVACAALALVACGFAVLSRNNGNGARVTAITHVNVTDANGMPASGYLGPGVALVVVPDGTGLRARDWDPGFGYRTYTIDPSAVAVDHRSPWQALTALARAVRAAWSPPA